MSSHHIVRDQQEPALIVQDASYVNRDTLDQLLEWAPTIVAIGDSLQWLVELGIKVDFALVDTEKEIPEDTLSAQTSISIVRLSGPTLASGLQILVRENHRNMNIITSEEGFMSSIDDLKTLDTSCQTISYYGNKRTIFYNRSVFRKWYPKGSRVQVESLNNGKVSFSGGERTIEDGVIHMLGDSEYCFSGEPPMLITEIIQ